MAKTAVDHMEVRWRVRDSGEAWSSPQRVRAVDEVVVEDLDRSKDYEFQARNVSACGAKSNWASALTHTVPSNNQRIGQGNLSMSTVGGIRSAWVGGAITYSATPTSATINVASGTLQDGVVNPAYAASSTTVSGTASTTVHYWLYYDDPSGNGGSLALGATTNYTALTASPGRVWVGELDVNFPASGTSSGSGTGGGGGPCVSVDSWVLERSRGWIVAGSVRVGDELRLLNPITLEQRWGVVSHSAPELAARVRFHAGGEALTCSTSAPIGIKGGDAIAASDLAGRRVPLLMEMGDGMKGVFAEVGEVEQLPDGLVQHITCENDFFLASDSPGAGFAHHNLKAAL